MARDGQPPPPEVSVPHGPPPVVDDLTTGPATGAATGTAPVTTEPSRRRIGRATRVVVGLALLLGVLSIAAYFVELPYYTISPGSALDMIPRVTVDGVPADEPDGEVMLLFVRQHADINAWQWLQASFDEDIDLHRIEEIRGDLSEEEYDVTGDVQMAQSQIAAKKVALEAAGYEVPRAREGIVVLGVFSSKPAGEVLEIGDVLLEADGTTLVEAGDLSEVVRQHEPGETVRLRMLRAGEEQEVEVGIATDDAGDPIIGVIVAPEYDFPVDIDVDTQQIGGPSAGLALTLSILDVLTEGDLTGGASVAVTGTIAEDGTVGEIGGINQKAVAARKAGADLFLVPACVEESTKQQCEADLARAKERAGDIEVVPVATLDDALRVLEEHGGAPVEPVVSDG